MVSRNIIEKTIENILTIKCKVNRIGTNSLNNNIKGGLNRFAEETKDLTHERVQLLDNKGNVLLEEDGDENHVSWNSIEALQYQQGDLINEHNHPTPFIQSTDKTFELSTCLSDRDVENLWKVDTIGFTEDGEDITGTVYKSVTCECGNGSRMTLTRIDGTSDNNFVIDDYIAKEFGGQPPKHTREEFDETYNMLKSDWQTMLHGFNNDYREHMNNWANKNNTKYNNRNEYTEEYNKEASKFRKNYARNNKTWNENLKFDIDAFKEIGFELSMEWVR